MYVDIDTQIGPHHLYNLDLLKILFETLKIIVYTQFKFHTVSILSVGVRLEGENRFFDTNRKDRNCILNQKECPLSIEALFNPSINYPQDPKNGLQVTPPQIGLTTIISRRKQK